METQKQRDEEILQELTHRTDGPVTKFVVIMRACTLSAVGRFHPHEVASVLDHILEEFEELPSNEY